MRKILADLGVPVLHEGRWANGYVLWIRREDLDNAKARLAQGELKLSPARKRPGRGHGRRVLVEDFVRIEDRIERIAGLASETATTVNGMRVGGAAREERLNAAERRIAAIESALSALQRSVSALNEELGIESR